MTRRQLDPPIHVCGAGPHFRFYYKFPQDSGQPLRGVEEACHTLTS